MKNKTLVIFLESGETLLFRDVENLVTTDFELSFDYFGKTTKTKRSAVFTKMNIAGYALGYD